MFMQPQIMPAMPSLVLGLAALALGILPLLNTFGILSFALPIPEIVFQITLVVVGFLLVLDSLLGFSLA
ncbi:MAG: hypothetical protein AB7V77_02835 [Candidatus Woesearchaeota archaeon]